MKENREDLIKYIRANDLRYADFDFNANYYSDAVLRVIKKRIERENEKRKK